MDLLNVNSNSSSIVDMLCSYWQLKLNERDNLFYNKVHTIMDSKMSAKLKNPSSMKFCGYWFELKGVFKETVSSQVKNSAFICVHAYLTLYGIGYYEMVPIKKKYDASCFIESRQLVHGLVGKAGNNAKLDQEVYDNLTVFFNDICNNEGDDYASRQVRTRLGQTYLRDNEEDGVRLPPSYSKRMLYNR